MPNPSPELLQAIAVTAELTNTEFSAPAARAMAEELATYPEHQVMGALRRCRRELTGRLSLAAVLERLPSGHPGPEEAWAMVAHALGDERMTVIVTEPMRRAFFAADQLASDPIAARMAFLEVYRRESAQHPGLPVWNAILGFDKAARESALLAAVAAGRLKTSDALVLLPAEADQGRLELQTGPALALDSGRANR